LKDAQAGQPGKRARTGPTKTNDRSFDDIAGVKLVFSPFSIFRRSMSDFGFSSPSSSSSSGGMNGAQRAELMEQVQSQLLVATLQEMLAVSFKHAA